MESFFVPKVATVYSWYIIFTVFAVTEATVKFYHVKNLGSMSIFKGRVTRHVQQGNACDVYSPLYQ